MRRLMFALFVLILPLAASAQDEPRLTETEVAAWREDLQALAAGIERVHPNPFWRIGEDAFDAIVADVEATLPAMTRTQAILGMARVANGIDGHSFFAVDAVGDAAFGMAPLWLYDFDDGLYVVQAQPPYESAIGQRVVAIGEHPIADVLDALAPHFVYDNSISRRVNRGVWPLFGDALHALGLTPDPARVPFVLENADGAQTTLETGLIPPSDYAAWTDWFWPGRMPQRDDMRYVQRHLDDSFWFTPLPDDEALYIQYNLTFASSPGGIYMSQFASQIRAAFTEQPYSRVILDLRHNGGGNNMTYAPLRNALLDIAPETTLIVLISRHTYSAATNLAVELEQDTDAVFIGEPTGGRPNLYSDARAVVLPNSRLVANISTRYWEFSTPDDPREAIAPDLAIPVLAADWFTGHDAALTAALGYTQDAG